IYHRNALVNGYEVTHMLENLQDFNDRVELRIKNADSDELIKLLRGYCEEKNAKNDMDLTSKLLLKLGSPGVLRAFPKLA
ncbi:MAG: hypothetical protein Q9181_005830, partial [Wetmoreana brouardii]